MVIYCTVVVSCFISDADMIGRMLTTAYMAIWPTFPCYILQVAFEPVSLHIPLHRFLSKTLVTLCSSSQYLSKHHLFDFKAWGISPLALMEFPLRALVLSFQIISARLWARNGPSVSSSALNYSTTPLCKQMRDLDIHLLQVLLSPISIVYNDHLTFSTTLVCFLTLTH